METIKTTARLQQLLKEKITVADLSEWADKPEKEQEIALEAAEKAIIQHRRKLMSAKKTAEYYAKLQQKETAPKYDYESLKARIKIMFPKFEIDDYNRFQFDKLCMYFSGSKMMSEHGLNENKGLFLMGNVGVGKTELMRMFCHNQINSYVMADCRMIAKEYGVKGSEILEQYKKPIETWHGGNLFMHDKFGVCFDDLGTEDEKKYFGNNENVMADIILSRYNNLNMSRQLTHVTTNLNPDELLNKYGSRINDRFIEMFNVVEFSMNAPSRRK